MNRKIKGVFHIPKSEVVTARISSELKKKIDSLNVNVTEVIRGSLKKAVEDAEELNFQHELIEKGLPNLTGELRRLTPKQRFEAYRDNRLSPESRLWMDAVRKAGINFWERSNLPEYRVE
ncbi:MAG: hypothetical protein NTV61_05510 [Candidatus Bathyarchaeota archaeon]|nr:hypothetical protein [Candidatus Bathyarchaeota archaeon]